MSTQTIAPSRTEFRIAKRQQESLLAGVEKRCLLWLAQRMPERVNSDHLTLLGLAAMLLAGTSYALSARWPWLLLAVNAWLAVNWFGDSLDGTLARYRNQQRPRYGFYVDHIVDSISALFLIGGLAISGQMSAWPAMGILVSFYLLSIDSYLATYTIGTFRLSFWKFSPTELRILLAVGNAAALLYPTTHVFGQTFKFFDLAGGIGAAAMMVVVIISVLRNTRTLYREERI